MGSLVHRRASPYDRSTLEMVSCARVLAASQEQSVKDKLLANTEASVVRGNFGSPTCFVGSEMFFGKDRLRDVEEEIVAQKAK